MAGATITITPSPFMRVMVKAARGKQLDASDLAAIEQVAEQRERRAAAPRCTYCGELVGYLIRHVVTRECAAVAAQ